jgi:hypothetical protein
MCQIIQGIQDGVPFRAWQCRGDPEQRWIESMGQEQEQVEDDSLDHLAATDAYLESDCRCTLEEYKHDR